MVPRSDWPNNAIDESIKKRVATETRTATDNFMVNPLSSLRCRIPFG
jgi:hypothetical protein